jgi:hypothetical protein
MAVYELNPFTKQMERVDSVIPPGSTLTGDTTLGLDVGYVPVDASLEQVDIYLSAFGVGTHFYVSKRDSSSNYVVIHAPTGKKINGADTLTIRYQYSTAHISCENDGNWSVI